MYVWTLFGISICFWDCSLGRSATLPYVEKKYYKNERYLRLVTHIFIKHSQNMCLINTDCIDILDVTASYGMSFDSVAFLKNFHTLLTSIYVWSVVFSPNFHRLYILLLAGITASYERFYDLIAVFWNLYILVYFYGKHM